MSDFAANQVILAKWIKDLTDLSTALSMAQQGEQMVQQQESRAKSAQEQLAKAEKEERERRDGLERFVAMLEEQRKNALASFEAGRAERAAIKAYDEQKLADVRFEIEKAQHELEAVRQRHRQASEELAKVYLAIDQAAERFGPLAGRTTKGVGG